MVTQNLHDAVRSGTMWMVELSYTRVSKLAPLFIWYPCCESSLRSRSPLYSNTMYLSESFILLLKFMLAISPGLPCICQVVITLSWAFPSLLSLMSASLTLIISHIARACLMSNQADPFYISFAAWFPNFFIGRGLFPKCRYPTHVSLHWV